MVQPPDLQPDGRVLVRIDAVHHGARDLIPVPGDLPQGGVEIGVAEEPNEVLFVSDPVEWVNLVLFLLIAVVVGRLAALQQERAADADRRAKEAQALFAVSRTLATASVIGRVMRCETVSPGSL